MKPLTCLEGVRTGFLEDMILFLWVRQERTWEVFWVHALPPVCYDSGTRGYCAMYPWVLAQPWSSPLRGERSGALPAGSPLFSGRTSEAPSPQLSPGLVAS